MIYGEPLRHPSAWRGEAMRGDSSWIARLSPAMCEEIDQALRAVEARGLDAAEFAAEDFPLPRTGDFLRRCRDEVERGRGFVLIRGLPAEQYDLARLRRIYWGIGTHLGVAVYQTGGAEILDISDKGQDVRQLGVKPHDTNAEQRPHSDPADLVALLCVRKAHSGGTSHIASSMAIYNEILATRPDQLACLRRGFRCDLRGDGGGPGVTPDPIPVFSEIEGVLSCVFNASTIKDAQRRTGEIVPAEEMAAVDHMVELARRDDIRLDMDFEPGDIQLLNNFTILHWRGAFTDHAEAERRRLLLRLWFSRPTARPVAPVMRSGYITGAEKGQPIPVRRRLRQAG
ncbi:hypothetical protein STVA_04480 [Allostella vacuolata]|nr:hypothetical protein STVA_04480 [Stella vacuolata]